MKYPVLILLIFISLGLPAEEIKTIADFIPPPETEKPLTDFIPPRFNPRTGLVISSAAVLTGITLTLVNLYGTADKVLADPGNPDIPRGLVLSATCLLGSGLWAVFTDYFLDKVTASRKNPKKAILQE